MADKKPTFDLANSHGVLNDMRDKSPEALNPSKSNFLSTVSVNVSRNQKYINNSK